MIKIISIAIVLFMPIKVFAQAAFPKDTMCNFLKDVKFKNGVDTIEVKATYFELFEISYNAMIKLLEKERKLNYSEYFDEKDLGGGFGFIPENCVKSFGGPLSRKVYDKAYIRKTKNIDDYVREILDFNQLKEGQIIYLKCIVYDDEKFKYHGNYFFTVIEIRTL